MRLQRTGILARHLHLELLGQFRRSLHGFGRVLDYLAALLGRLLVEAVLFVAFAVGGLFLLLFWGGSGGGGEGLLLDAGTTGLIVVVLLGKREVVATDVDLLYLGLKAFGAVVDEEVHKFSVLEEVLQHFGNVVAFGAHHV